MRRKYTRWLVSPLFVLMTTTCGDNALNSTPTTCLAGVDTDGDGVNDDVECKLGTNPNNPDTDGDGIPDGVEINYPKICVAMTPSAQRPPVPPLRTGQTPPPPCTTTADCLAGESCNGLDPLKSDSDGDGVPDNQEDPSLDGVINFSMGETDPRLYDTDGDGQSDATSGSRICRPDGLATVVIKPSGNIQLGMDPTFVGATAVPGITMGRAAVFVDEDATGTAGLVVSQSPRGTDARTDSQAVEADLTTTLGAKLVGAFVGKPFTTHEQLPAIRSTYIYTAAASTSASGVRDLLIPVLTGGAAPGLATAGNGNTVFYVDVTTVRRAATADDVIIGVSPQVLSVDPTKATAIRVDDLLNASGVTQVNQDLGFLCQGVVASRLPTADFLWTVDVSASMSDNQVLVANAATTFVQKMISAGVDYRIGVFNAEGNPANAIDFASTAYAATGWPAGFFMIPTATMLTNPGPDRWLCRYVTSLASGKTGFCPADTALTDKLSPFGIDNGANAREEPAAAAVRINDIMKKNKTNNVTNPDWTWRTNATKASFFITDEFGNDWNRYFTSANNPDTGTAFSAGGYNATTLANIVGYFKSNQILTYGMVPLDNATKPRTCAPTPNLLDLTRCVIEGNGGAFLNIVGSTQAQVDAAMDQIANDIIGASSPIVLDRSPITSTIKVTVAGVEVPRSRLNGFDYNQASKSIVFYGGMYRPKIGDVVYVSYRVWNGSLG